MMMRMMLRAASISLALLILQLSQATEEIPTDPSRDLQSSVLRVDADVYECDENNARIVDPPRKDLNALLKLCIVPATRTRNRDVFIRSIESLELIQTNEVYVNGTKRQILVQNRVEVGSTKIMTMMVCLPGSELCTVQTELDDVIFYYDKQQIVNGGGNISVIGEIAMQFGTLDKLWTRNRALQFTGGDGNYAGSAQAAYVFPIKQREGTPPSEKEDEDEEDHWWKDSPSWQRMLLILASILTFCVFCCCFAACCFWMREDCLYTDEGKEDEPLDKDDEEDHSDREYNEEESFVRHEGSARESYSDDPPRRGSFSTETTNGRSRTSASRTPSEYAWEREHGGSERDESDHSDNYSDEKDDYSSRR